MGNEKILREQLLFLLRGGNAHQNLEEAVNNFPLELINEHVSYISYSPWQLLEHIRIAQHDILNFILDPEYQSPEWPKGYWPDNNKTADKDDWEKTIEKINNESMKLRRLVEDSNNDLSSPLKHEPNFSLLREILLAADHNAYHLGQFVLLKKILVAIQQNKNN